jgi:hypothetical protein
MDMFEHVHPIGEPAMANAHSDPWNNDPWRKR